LQTLFDYAADLVKQMPAVYDKESKFPSRDSTVSLVLDNPTPAQEALRTVWLAAVADVLNVANAQVIANPFAADLKPFRVVIKISNLENDGKLIVTAPAGRLREFMAWADDMTKGLEQSATKLRSGWLRQIRNSGTWFAYNGPDIQPLIQTALGQDQYFTSENFRLAGLPNAHKVSLREDAIDRFLMPVGYELHHLTVVDEEETELEPSKSRRAGGGLKSPTSRP
jgi:hypothetical protein